MDAANQTKEYPFLLDNPAELIDVFVSSRTILSSLKSDEKIKLELIYNELSPRDTLENPEKEWAARYRKNLDIINEIKSKTRKINIVKAFIENYIIM